MKNLRKTKCHSDAYVEWSFAVYPIAASRDGVIWACRIDLIGESPHQVFDGGHTPLEAFCRALALADQARIQHNWLRRN